MNETTSAFVAIENNSVDSEGTDRSEWSKNVSKGQLVSQFPLLVRFAWQNQQAFLIVVIKAKQFLDMAEITTTFWD